MIYSCKGCEKRFPGCHSQCETYIKEKAEHEKRKAIENRENAISMGLTAQRTAAVTKALKGQKNRFRNIGRGRTHGK